MIGPGFGPLLPLPAGMAAGAFEEKQFALTGDRTGLRIASTRRENPLAAVLASQQLLRDGRTSAPLEEGSEGELAEGIGAATLVSPGDTSCCSDVPPLPSSVEATIDSETVASG